MQIISHIAYPPCQGAHGAIYVQHSIFQFCLIRFDSPIAGGSGEYHFAMAESLERMQSLPTRQWSTSSLLRGASFLKDQAKKESMDYQDVLAVARLLLSHFLEVVMHWETAITLNPRLQEHASRSWLLRSLRRPQTKKTVGSPGSESSSLSATKTRSSENKPDVRLTKKQAERASNWAGLGFPKHVPCWGGLPLPKKPKTLKGTLHLYFSLVGPWVRCQKMPNMFVPGTLPSGSGRLWGSWRCPGRQLCRGYSILIVGWAPYRPTHSHIVTSQHKTTGAPSKLWGGWFKFSMNEIVGKLQPFWPITCSGFVWRPYRMKKWHRKPRRRDLSKNGGLQNSPKEYSMYIYIYIPIYYHSCIIKYLHKPVYLYTSIFLDLYILYIYIFIYCVCAQLRTPFSLRTPFKGKFVYICCIWFAVKNNNIICMHAFILTSVPLILYSFSIFPSLSGQEITAETRRMQALSAMLRRLCRPKESSGRLEVSPEIHKQWAAGGDQRKALLDILIKTNGNKAGFKKQHANNQLKNERFR